MNLSNKKTISLCLWLIMAIPGIGCKDYLDAKSNKKLVVPTTLEDFQSLLDNQNKLNNSDPVEGEISADDYTISSSDWNGLASDALKRMYIWKDDYLFTPQTNAWYYTYTAINYSNTVLDGLNKIPMSPANQSTYKDVKGQAYFFRAKFLLQATIIWVPAYDSSTSDFELGLPIRLSPDFNIPSKRANVTETYSQIIKDLKAAAMLLPVSTTHPMRPSRVAALGFLGRTYLAMRDYHNAGIYADSALQYYNTLLDYNTLDSTKSYPMPRFNSEVIMASRIPISQIFSSSRPKIDSVLFHSYHTDDLRKAMFFMEVGLQHTFKGSYEGDIALFGGIATDELYLIRAECYARNGNTVLAMNDLNTLLIKRWKSGTYVPFKASSPTAALLIILSERRKELLMRGLRWMDLKRLNKEGANIVLRREINNIIYTLEPNNVRYALPIPEDIINISGMPQNPR